MPPPAIPDTRFDRHQRLRSRADFDRVFQQGTKVASRQIVAWILPADPDGPSRLGLSVGRRVGNAPRRNRVKRCLRVAFRELSPTFPEPIEIVLLARPAAPPDSRDEAVRALRKILERHARKAAPKPRKPRRESGRKPGRETGRGATG